MAGARYSTPEPQNLKSGVIDGHLRIRPTSEVPLGPRRSDEHGRSVLKTHDQAVVCHLTPGGELV